MLTGSINLKTVVMAINTQDRLDWNTTSGTSTNCCDRCYRSLEGKGWLEINQMKICGICQYEMDNQK